MKSGGLTSSAILVWASCVIYAIGMIVSNYAVGTAGIIIVSVELVAVAVFWIAKFAYRLRFTILLASAATLHLAIMFRPATQPVGSLWLFGLSLILFLVSLFLPRNDDVPNS